MIGSAITTLAGGQRQANVPVGLTLLLIGVFLLAVVNYFLDRVEHFLFLGVTWLMGGIGGLLVIIGVMTMKGW